ncbi:MAG: vWA domain-containing protein [Thermacetogeniaceae bacterium]
MGNSLLFEEISLQEISDLAHEIGTILAGGQGFRLGESTVISYFIHKINRKRPEEVQIFVNRDAGLELAQENSPCQVIHLDVFHEPARVEAYSLAQTITEAVRIYQNKSQFYTQDLSKRIHLETGTGTGTLEELTSKRRNTYRGKNKNHVHVLLRRFTQSELVLIPYIVDAIETELANQGVEIRKVERILHIEGGAMGSLPAFLTAKFNPLQRRLWRQASFLTSVLSSPEDVIEFLQAFQPGLFRQKQSLAQLRNKHGNLRELLTALEQAGLIRRGIVRDVLTPEGTDLLNFVIQHQRELESQMCKLLRSVPIPRSKYFSVRKTRTRTRARDKSYRYAGKTAAPMKDSWVESIAVPETIIEAAKRKFTEKRNSFFIKREDIRVHQKVVSKPIDICLLIDGSASMSGPKMKAAWLLAEHLLLTTRDKVAVVVFQEKQGRIVTPFTRNYTRLKLGLRSIQPRGMTPLAEGINEAIKLIKNRPVHNPLLILITDGIPTYSRYTINPEEDALKAASRLRELRIKVICIGVESNRRFLEKLAEHADANLYIVENLEDQAALIEIARRERKL